MIELAATGRLLDELQDALSKHPGIEKIGFATRRQARTNFAKYPVSDQQ